MVTLESIKNTFEKMSEDGVNVEKELLWGFFFTNKTPDKLTEVGNKLKNQGYSVVDIYQDDNGLFWLNIEKVGIYTPETLYEVCNNFYDLAKEYELDSFDGYDVGNPQKDKPINEV